MTEQAKNKKKYIGTIFALNETRGFGFITSKDEDLKFEKLFFHWTALKNETVKFTELKRGDPVEFEIMEVPDKGKRAINIDALERDGDKNDKKSIIGNVESS